MKITTTTTSKGQLTIPKTVREKLGLQQGIKVDIYTTDDGFIGRIHRKSKLLDFAGDLKDLDNGKSFDEIRNITQEKAAKEIVQKKS
jgi:AbrB family looped-hinge helix DNA binding protein